MPSKRAAALVAAGAAGLAGAGFAADRWSRRAIRRFESLDAEKMRLPGSRFWVRGVAVHYVEAGSGFPVVLVHGFGGSTFNYRYLIPALADQFRVIAVDLPGFGYSDRGVRAVYSQAGWVELLAEFLARLGVERAVFVGHSLGGAVAQRMALTHPELVERLILVASVSAAEPVRIPPVAIAPLLRVAQAVMSVRPGGYLPMMRGAAYDPAYLQGAVVEEYLRPLKLAGSAAAMRTLIANLRREKPLDVTGIHVSALLLWGEHDGLLPPAAGERLHGAIAGSRFEVIPRTAHLPLEEQPEQCNRLIIEFLHDLATNTEPPLPVAGG